MHGMSSDLIISQGNLHPYLLIDLIRARETKEETKKGLKVVSISYWDVPPLLRSRVTSTTSITLKLKLYKQPFILIKKLSPPKNNWLRSLQQFAGTRT